LSRDPENTISDRTRFIFDNTEVLAPPHVPEIRLHLASDVSDLWHKTEGELAEIGLPPPFWAFAWAGGQGLARYVLDNAEMVRGKAILDIASGSGLVAIAAGMAGARLSVANDTDPFASHASTVNAALNNVSVDFSDEDFLSLQPGKLVRDKLHQFDCIFAGDVFYDSQMSLKIWPLLQEAAAMNKLVLVGDPGRSYLPNEGLEKLVEYEVPVFGELEDASVKKTAIWQVA
jgi:predicted nicotinamide N-methyase